jgi:hypothetical protein
MSVGGRGRKKVLSTTLEAGLPSLRLIKDAADLLPPLKTAASLAVSIIGQIKVRRF